MNNIIISVKRFLQNKNTVTILGVLAIILILFFGYRYQINKMVSPVSGIPVAADTIQPRTKITKDMIEYVDVAPIVLQSNVIRTGNNVIGKYTAVNTVVPAGSMFYTNTIVDESELPDAAFIELEDGDIPYNFPVNMDTTYGNSIFPGNYIDIYMKAVNEEGVLMVGKFIENVKVLAVRDSSGRNVFENSDETRTPAYLIFGLNSELNILLRKASYMGNYSVVLFPVPHGQEPSDLTVNVSSQTLKEFVNANTVPNDELTNNTTTDENTDNTTDNTNNNNTNTQR